ncbi:MAG TPA: AAA family ATPase [Chryseosolibacter sp.]
MTKDEKFSLIHSVFSPTAPVEQRDLFYGRLDQFKKLAGAITERGQHAILYGDRGVGKTSLSNIAAVIFGEVTVSKVTCNRTEDFRSIWDKAFQKIRFSKDTGIGFRAASQKVSDQLNLFLPDVDNLASNHIESVLEHLNTKLLFIFDEFDSIKDPEIKMRMADTIKALSDNVKNVTVLIVGIANDVNDLIGEHPSLERCLLQIHMPLMSNGELSQIIDNGLKKLNLTISTEVKNKIIEYSSGYPSYTHLLCKYASIEAIDQDANEITTQHFTTAVKESIENTTQSLRNDYQAATITSKGATQFDNVLFACALAPMDEFNCFSAKEMTSEYNKITGKNSKSSSLRYHIDTLCSADKGSILEKIGVTQNVKYKFRNPMMKAFVRLKIHESNRIKKMQKPQ